jgi:hypothetical protein
MMDIMTDCQSAERDLFDSLPCCCERRDLWGRLNHWDINVIDLNCTQFPTRCPTTNLPYWESKDAKRTNRKAVSTGLQPARARLRPRVSPYQRFPSTAARWASSNSPCHARSWRRFAGRLGSIFACILTNPTSVLQVFELLASSSMSSAVDFSALSRLLVNPSGPYSRTLDTDTAVDSSASARHCLNRRPLELESSILICSSIDTLSLWWCTCVSSDQRHLLTRPCVQDITATCKQTRELIHPSSVFHTGPPRKSLFFSGRSNKQVSRLLA